MPESFFQFLVVAFLTMLLFMISIPVHEFGHLLMFRLLGSKTPFIVEWRGGKVTPPNGIIHLPRLWRRIYNLVFFLVCAGGGWMVTMIFSGIYFFLPTGLSWAWVYATPLLVVGFTEIIYGFYEGFQHLGRLQPLSETHYRFQ